uniref:Inhibitor_I29 domain-containing protein n=1 Tax=Caenorhabditis tropicalis TaxID=1561998 RepID=A0A1I7U432_9PELO
MDYCSLVKPLIFHSRTSSLNSFAVVDRSINSSAPLTLIHKICAFLETYRQHVFIVFCFVAINLVLFFERFWHYRYMTENRDLRRVMGAGIAITRGAAGALSFCMALILLTVCRNIITLLRETVISQYIPFDSAIAFHKEVLSNFDKFQAHHNRRYRNHAERTKRLGHFAKNHQRIKELNEEARKGGRNVTFGWNRFADMPKEERHARFSKIHPRNHSDLPIYKPRHPRQHRAKREIPGSFDLREVYINGSPIIGPVKDQGELINQNPLRGGLNWNLIICH